MQSQQPDGKASLLDMAVMFANKYEKDGHLSKEDNVTPLFFVQLLNKINVAKEISKNAETTDWSKIEEYLETNK
jgi:hypothetical protein